MIETGIDPKILSIVIFLITYVLIMSNKIDRTIAALMGAVMLYLFGVLEGEQILEKINWEALGLIFGMFVLVGALRESGFFRWVGLKTLKLAKFDAIKIFILFSVLAAFLSAFMDSITVLLFMSSLTIEVCGMLGMNPMPFIISEICSANIGGSATMMGDPPNIIIGTGCNLSFVDFLVNTGPVAVVVFGVNLVFFYMWYKKTLKTAPPKSAKEIESINPREAIKDSRLMKAGLFAFIIAVGLLMVHHVFHIPIAFIGLFGASLVLVTGGRKMPEVIEKLDWLTLIFFSCLFIVVGGLEETGVLGTIASFMAKMGGGPVVLIMLIMWVSAFVSAFVDNVPFAATMVPIIKSLAADPALGLSLPTMSWALALGTDIGGNATPIGASANVVGLAIAEKSGYRVSWGYYCKVGFVSMTIAMAVSSLIVWLRYFVL